MFEKVNPAHPDKVADRIAGALVDLAYKTEQDPKIAVEVLIGHGVCHIIAESSVDLDEWDVENILDRIAPGNKLDLKCVKQDEHLAKNQKGAIRCGDNGIFRGVPVTEEQRELSRFAHYLYRLFPSDGKFIVDADTITVCQSNAKATTLLSALDDFAYRNAKVNPIGEWTGGTNVDTGATNRKLGSDMADSVTGGGLHGKDLSKADVSINIYAWLKAQRTGKVVELSCSIGDEYVDDIPYSRIVEIARGFINEVGGFEKLAEWGLDQWQRP